MRKSTKKTLCIIFTALLLLECMGPMAFAQTKKLKNEQGQVAQKEQLKPSKNPKSDIEKKKEEVKAAKKSLDMAKLDKQIADYNSEAFKKRCKANLTNPKKLYFIPGLLVTGPYWLVKQSFNAVDGIISYPFKTIGNGIKNVIKISEDSISYPFKTIINPNYRLQPPNIVLVKQREKLINELNQASEDLEGDSKTYVKNVIKELEKDISRVAALKPDNIDISSSIEYASYIEDLYRRGAGNQSRLATITTLPPLLLSSISIGMSFTGVKEAAAIVGLTGSSILSLNETLDPKKRQLYFLEGLELINKSKRTTILLSDENIDLVETAKIVNNIDETLKELEDTQELKKDLHSKVKNKFEIHYLDLISNIDRPSLEKLFEKKKEILKAFGNNPSEFNKESLKKAKKDFIVEVWSILTDNALNHENRRFATFQKNVNKLAETLEEQKLEELLAHKKTDLAKFGTEVTTFVKKVRDYNQKQSNEDTKKAINDDIDKLKLLYEYKATNIKNEIESQKDALKKARYVYDDSLALIQSKYKAGPMLVLAIEQINTKIGKLMNAVMPDFSKVRNIVHALPGNTLEFTGYNAWAKDQVTGKRMDYGSYLNSSNNNSQEDKNTGAIKLRIEENVSSVVIYRDDKFNSYFKKADGSSIFSEDSKLSGQLDTIEKSYDDLVKEDAAPNKEIKEELNKLKEQQNKVTPYLRIYMDKLIADKPKL